MAAPQSQIAVQQTQDKLRQQDLTKDLDPTSGDIKNRKKLSDFAVGKQRKQDPCPPDGADVPSFGMPALPRVPRNGESTKTCTY